MPPVGIEPTLLSEPDFESGASTSSTTGAPARERAWMGADYTVKHGLVNSLRGGELAIDVA